MVTLHWQCFCRVIDNFGDIGVCWRLAKQLHHSHQQKVTLWVDDLASFAVLEPRVDPNLNEQECGGICVRHWTEDFAPLTPEEVGDVVIEAFACELPDNMIHAMSQRSTPPVWINLEYLTAESWAHDFHRQYSPRHGMHKVFFFPGFTDQLGGLLWEPSLLSLPETMSTIEARDALLNELGISVPFEADYYVSLFSYENDALQSLLQSFSTMAKTVHVLVPEGRISQQLEQFLGEPLAIGETIQRGALIVSTLPFMAQETYDRLLAMCDVNFVRGEESFVRAQMLGKPFIWHIYQQEEDAHLIKLQAFLQLYLSQAPHHLAQGLQKAFDGWNQKTEHQSDWSALFDDLENWQKHAQSWQTQQIMHRDLASNLVHYVTNAL